MMMELRPWFDVITENSRIIKARFIVDIASVQETYNWRIDWNINLIDFE